MVGSPSRLGALPGPTPYLQTCRFDSPHLRGGQSSEKNTRTQSSRVAYFPLEPGPRPGPIRAGNCPNLPIDESGASPGGAKGRSPIVTHVSRIERRRSLFVRITATEKAPEPGP
jgi:hypothetical protein